MPDASSGRTPADPGVGRALVVGAGVTGRAVVGALRAAGVGVALADADPARLVDLPDGVEALPVADARPLLGRVDVLVPSPGVPEHDPLLVAAAELGLPVWSEPELAGRLHPDRTVLGITGTNGKTSVTELVTEMLVASGVPAVACGNIGTPLVTAAGAPGDDVLVAELSSFQLRFVDRLRVRVAALLNLAPDHLDWHGDLDSYRAAKARIWRGQHEEDVAVTDAQRPDLLDLARSSPGRTATFSAVGGPPVGGLGTGVVGGDLVADLGTGPRPVVSLAAADAVAPHRRANLAAAAAVALLAGGSAGGVAAAAGSWRPGHHRMEVVGEVGGVTWVDDSKATNPHAAAAALAAPVPGGGRTVWLAGGLAKGVDLAVLAGSLGGVRHAVLLGAAAPELARVAGGAGVPVTVVDGDEPMAEAVAVAAARARPGDRVLLSPACASFDLFEGYADRGRRFAAAVGALDGGAA